MAGLVLAATASSSATAFAQDTVDVNANALPWSSVGKIYNSARSSCTGSVIARDKVLTVAHCLYNRAAKRFLQAESLHFLLGYKSGEYRAHALVATYSVGANYNPEDTDKSILADWAILTLTAPIATLTTPLQLARKPPAAGEQIMVGGFSQRHPFKMTADTDCRVRGVMPNGLIGHDCVVMRGLSGAPLLKQKADSSTEIVGLHVATGKSMGSSIGLAVPVATLAQQAFASEH